MKLRKILQRRLSEPFLFILRTRRKEVMLLFWFGCFRIFKTPSTRSLKRLVAGLERSNKNKLNPSVPPSSLASACKGVIFPWRSHNKSRPAPVQAPALLPDNTSTPASHGAAWDLNLIIQFVRSFFFSFQ